MANEEIKRRIRHLEMLRKGASNEHEAAVAAGMVAKLLEKYNLELGTALIEEQGYGAEPALVLKGRRKDYVQACVQATGLLLDVKYYWANIPVQGERRNVCFFYGAKANAEAATETVRYLIDSCKHLVKNYLVARPVRAQFAYGVAIKIYKACEALREARVKATQSAGEQALLVLTTTESMILKYEQEHAGLFAHLQHGKQAVSVQDQAAFQAGYVAGDTVDVEAVQSQKKKIEAAAE